MVRMSLLVALAACSGSTSARDDGGGVTDATDPDATTADAATTGTSRPSSLGGGAVPGSPGCSAAAGATGVRPITIGARTGTIMVPAEYDATKAYPIVFVFHGDGGTGTQIRAALDLEPDAAGKAIFAYPDGVAQTWDATLATTNQDMSFVMALRTQLRATYCVDTTRTFLTGMSRGGFFVNQLACMYGIAEFAAIAPHSSTIEQDDGAAYLYGPPVTAGGPYAEHGNYDFACPSDGSPAPARPILPPPVLVIHGECDTEQGVTFADGRMVAEHWGYAGHCSTTPAVSVTTSPNPSCSGALTSNPTLTVDPCYKGPGCTAGHDITFCAIPSMGHQVWANAHCRIWAFFAAH